MQMSQSKEQLIASISLRRLPLRIVEKIVEPIHEFEIEKMETTKLSIESKKRTLEQNYEVVMQNEYTEFLN